MESLLKKTDDLQKDIDSLQKKVDDLNEHMKGRTSFRNELEKDIKQCQKKLNSYDSSQKDHLEGETEREDLEADLKSMKDWCRIVDLSIQGEKEELARIKLELERKIDRMTFNRAVVPVMLEKVEYPSGLLSCSETDDTPDDKRIDPENPGKFEWIYHNYEAVYDIGTFGKWLVFIDFNNLNTTWRMIIDAKKRGQLKGCVALKTSTKVYQPSSYGPGSCTTGVIEVYTTKGERKSVGESLCLLVKQDIMYKTEKATREGLYAGNEQNKPVTLHTMSYNGGHPLLDEPGKRIYYQAARDIWHLNIVDSPHYPKSEPFFGKWIIELTKKEATGVWHILKNQIEEKQNGILKMECPKGDKNSPVFYVYTTSKEWESVGEQLRQLMKQNLNGPKKDFRLEYIKMEEEASKEEELRYLKAYEYFTKIRKSIDLPFLKVLLLGPPGLGKTTALRRLIGEIVDLMSAGEAEVVHPSTGTVESGTVIVRSVTNTTAIVTQTEWSAAHDLLHRVCILLNELHTWNTTSSPKSLDNVSIQNQPTRSEKSALLQPSTSPSRATSQPAQADPSSPKQETNPRQALQEILKLLQDAISSKHLKDEKQIFKAYIRVEDTGGQPELMDMLPALTIGPGLYLLFTNLQNDLDHHYKLVYRSKSNAVSLPVESNYTVKETLLSSLSSIACFNASPSSSSMNAFVNQEVISGVRNIQKSSKSVAYIVGTHKDKVSEQDIKKMNEDLQGVIESSAFRNFVEFFSEDELIVTLNNMNGGDEEVQKVRALLEKGMARHFKELTIPAAWLLFSLILEKRDKRTATVEDCKHLAQELSMSSDETEVALWFLHHHAGVLMYFPKIPELSDLVIINVQVVYDSVTILIIKAMSFDDVGHKASEDLRKTGQFTFSSIIKMTSETSGDLIPPHKLVALLEFLHIIAPLPTSHQPSLEASSSQEVSYIMPCVLRNATKEELNSITKEAHGVCPLMIRFECGFVPIGIFPALITCLVKNKSFRLIHEGIKKNVVKFFYRPHYTSLTFICHSTYYEVISHFSTPKIEPHVECDAIRRKIQKCFNEIESYINYSCIMNYQFAFECPIHQGREHLCVLEDLASVEMMLCLHNTNDPKPVQLNDEHKVWFGQELPRKQSSTSTRNEASNPQAPGKPLNLMSIIEILNEGDFSAADCGDLGIMLGLKYPEIRNIQHNNVRNVRAQLNDIIISWLKNEKNPTWEKLATALTKCGYKVLASTLCNKDKLSDISPEDEKPPTKQPKLEKELPTLEEIKKHIYHARGSHGSIAICGRNLHYRVKRGIASRKHVHEGEAWDEGTGTRHTSGKKRSQDNAREHALANLVTDLYNKGLFSETR